MDRPRTTTLYPLGVEFDAFLFASIAEDRNGLSLSVISALARLELDPWEEAATLARLPAAAAIGRLVSTLGHLPEELRYRFDLGKASTRLIALLPRRAAQGSTPTQQASPPLTWKTKLPALLGGTFMIVMILFSFVAAQLQPASKNQTTSSTTSSGSASPKPDLPQAGQ